ncbi:hypothetical protein [Oricola nitratireducens]|uniref:hypothetical protein n=1 Tax=Oricola nitratireducens TaxID=2775868 RepID=UPI001866FAB0|nr:hypothetical protein [Oricola nitratireducens]
MRQTGLLTGAVVAAIGVLLIALDLFLHGYWLSAAGICVLAVVTGLLAAAFFKRIRSRLLRLENAMKHDKAKLTSGLDRLQRDIRDSARSQKKFVERQTFDLSAQILYQNAAKHRVNARGLPLVLISQAPRSGGTFLSQLFDGHPNLLAFPHELKWGGDVKHQWPAVDPSDGTEQVAEALIHNNLKDLRRFNLHGYQKAPESSVGAVLPHRWSYWRYVETFADEWSNSPPNNRRACLDIFLSAYFGAFHDWRGLETDKKAVTAFTPGTFSPEEETVRNQGFFEDYRDGFMIRLCRDPVDWYASASRHNEKFADRQTALAIWERSARSACILKDAQRERVVLIGFKSLIERPREVMDLLAQKIGVPFDEAMLTPSFNGWSVTSNSSFRSTSGIDMSVLGRASELPSDVRSEISEACSDTYRQFLAQADI